jgi:hypothetical protein
MKMQTIPYVPSTERASVFDRVSAGINGLPPLVILRLCRAIIAAFGDSTAHEIRELGLKDAMVAVAEVPKAPSVKLIQTVGDLSLPQAARLYDACRALTEVEATFSLVVDLDRPSA